MAQFEKKLSDTRKKQTDMGGSSETIQLEFLSKGINEDLAQSQKFSSDEIVECLKVMTNDNRIWFREDVGEVMFI